MTDDGRDRDRVRPPRGPGYGDRGRGADRPARDGDSRPRRDGDSRPRREGDSRPRREGDSRPRRDGGGGPRRQWEDRPPRDDRGDRARRPREDRPRDPEISDDVEAGQLDKVLRSELRTLSKENADMVARHMVVVGQALDAEDFDLALAHAEAAGRRAGRVAGVRETLGVVHYRRGEWAKALAEFRTARRLSGTHHLIPLMADTERGLGRPERALEMAATPEAKALPAAEQVELAIVVSGARADLGQTAAAVLHLTRMAEAGRGTEPWAARLRYAYAAALEADGQVEEANRWYALAADVDPAGETDAAELLGLTEAVDFVDLGEDEDELTHGGVDETGGQPPVAGGQAPDGTGVPEPGAAPPPPAEAR